MPRDDLLIRQLRPGDESLLRRLSEDDARFAVDREPVRAIGPLDDEDATAFLRRHDIFLFAALDGGELVGFVLGYQLPRRHGDTAMLYIHELGVRANRRREGIGRALMDALWTVARTYDIERAFLCTNTSHAPAMAFYASLGAVRTAPDDVVLSWHIPRAVVPPDHRHPTLERGPVRLRPATPDDTDLLIGWFADPEVYRWWDGRPATREEVVRDYIGALCPEVEVFIVESDGAPVGMLQYYLLGPVEGGLDICSSSPPPGIAVWGPRPRDCSQGTSIASLAGSGSSSTRRRGMRVASVAGRTPAS